MILTLFLVTLAGCGSESDPEPAPAGPTITALSANASHYWVGDQAKVTVAFQNGTGVLEPDGIAVSSGQTVTTPELSAPIRYRLVVTDGKTTVTRNLVLDVRYRDRLRALAMPFARGGHRAVWLYDDRVLIVGGEDASGALPATVQVFDPVTETFRPFAQLGSGRSGFIAQGLYGGEVLVTGGIRAVPTAPEAELIDHVTGGVTPTLNSPVPGRVHAASTLLMDGRVFISGGQVGGKASGSVELFDPATRSFTQLAGTLRVARYLHTVVRIDHRRLLVYGGYTDSPQAAPPEIYDVVDGTSTLLSAPESTVRANHEAITLQDGGILLVGGEDHDRAPLATVLRFDPATSTFAPYATLATPRTATALHRLMDGRLFVAGGATTRLSSDSTPTTELISDTAQRHDGPAMGVSRRDHSVTRLSGGKLLVVGGLGTDLRALSSAELYE